ncbi:Uncharacterised protein [uncultured archaeon]|nr:Uncharacterised protein [uncultured archaeon]
MALSTRIPFFVLALASAALLFGCTQPATTNAAGATLAASTTITVATPAMGAMLDAIQCEYNHSYSPTSERLIGREIVQENQAATAEYLQNGTKLESRIFNQTYQFTSYPIGGSFPQPCDWYAYRIQPYNYVNETFWKTASEAIQGKGDAKETHCTQTQVPAGTFTPTGTICWSAGTQRP